MREPTIVYENYPPSTVALRNLLNVLIIAAGGLILSEFGAWAGVSYAAFFVFMMVWIMRFRCKYCYYYGRRCSSGYGTVASFLFEKGNNEDFPKYIKYVAPLFLVWILPTVAGIILLITRFSIKAAGLLAFFMLITFFASERVLARAGCVHCGQRENCPAYQLKHGVNK